VKIEMKERKKLLIVVAVFALVFACYTVPAWTAEQTIHLKVDGMTCPMCPPAVSKALKGVEGVKSAEVSLEEGKAVVVAEEDVKIEALLKAVEEAGHYKAQVIEE
jgi:copper chaperone CopZ